MANEKYQVPLYIILDSVDEDDYGLTEEHQISAPADQYQRNAGRPAM